MKYLVDYYESRTGESKLLVVDTINEIRELKRNFESGDHFYSINKVVIKPKDIKKIIFNRDYKDVS